MEQSPFKFTFTEEDMGVLQAPSQADLWSLYRRMDAVSTGYDAEAGAKVGRFVPSGDASVASLDTDIHVVLRVDPETCMKHGATLKVSVLQDDGPAVHTYDLWWKEDFNLDGGAYFELKRGGKSCDADTARTLLGYLSPDATATEVTA